MPNNHAICSTMRCTCVDVDAYNAVGISTTDMDNGVLVTLGAIDKTGNAINGFQYTVTAPVANATGLWLVRTPLPGSTVEMQFMNDPRYFYNVAGRPMHLCYMNPGVDVIEVDANAFTSGSAPSDQPSYGYATVTASTGKLAVANAAPASGTYFIIEGTHTISVGQDIVTTYVLRCARN